MTVVKRKVTPKSGGKQRVIFGGVALTLIALLYYVAWIRPSENYNNHGPLCDECWDLVRSMPHVDISIRYYDTTTVNHNGHQRGRVVGARNEEGHMNPFFYDETALHRNPEPFHISPEKREEFCQRRDDEYLLFQSKFVVDVEYDKKQQANPRTLRPKILCIVCSVDDDHEKIRMIRQTWGSKCDGFVVISSQTDLALGVIDVPHDGPAEYSNKWQKVRSAWTFVHRNYYETYDWFFLAQQDSFLLIENLRHYLESDEIRIASNGGGMPNDGNSDLQTPLYLGRRFALAGIQSEIFNGSGPGYLLNKAALQSLVVDAFPTMDDKLLHAISSSHDTLLAQALRAVGIRPYPTQDGKGGERFMPFLPHHHYNYRFPANPSNDWYAKWSLPGVKEGADHFAARSIAFHYAIGDDMARLYTLAYGLCEVAETRRIATE